MKHNCFDTLNAKKNTWINLKELLHLAKFAIANIVQVIAQVIRKVERSKIE